MHRRLPRRFRARGAPWPQPSGSPPACRSRSAPPGTGRGSTSRSSRPTPRRIELCLFDADGPPRDRPHRAAGVHPRGLARLLPRPAPRPALRAARARALRAGGRAPLQPATSCCSTPTPGRSKGELRWHDSLYGYRIGHPRGDLSFDRRDSARAMPKCRIIDPSHTWGTDRRAAARLGRDGDLRGARQGHDPQPSRAAAAASPAPSRGWARRRWSSIWRASG